MTVAASAETDALSERSHEILAEYEADKTRFTAAKLVAMNNMAQAIREAGITTDLPSFLFAMYGVEFGHRGEERSKQQRKLEKREMRFSSAAAGSIFASKPGDRDVYMYGPFDTDTKYNSDTEWIATALRYRLYDGPGRYHGAVVVPAYMADQLRDDVDIRREDYLVASLQREHDATQPYHEYFAATVFGRHIVDWSTFGRLDLDVAALRRLNDTQARLSQVVWRR